MYFYLYRLKAYRGKIFSYPGTRSQFFNDLINHKPSSELRKGYKWHIGNISRFSEDGVIFAIGRTTKFSVEKYDEESGNFIQGKNDESPFTYVIHDEKNGVLAVGSKARLSPTTKGIANSLQKLLNEHIFTRSNNVRFEIAEIVDPEGFIKSLKSAYEVVGFKMHFTEPNPFDVEEDFHKPMEKLLEKAGASQGVTQISGCNLDKEVLEDLTRSVASTGNTVSARVREEEGLRPKNKMLNGSAVSVKAIGALTQDTLVGLLDKVRSAYDNIRR
nr:hypothetical protein [Pseudomonas sp.]